MFARRTLLQVATKLAIGLGALFLVGVLLAAIPNHRPPVVAGSSTLSEQKQQGTDHSAVPNMNRDEPKSIEKDAVQGMAHRQDGDSTGMDKTAPKAGDSAR
jgi:hypothetical protein